MKKNTHIIILLVVLFMLFSNAIKAVDPDVWYRTTGEKTTPKTESSSSSSSNSSSLALVITSIMDWVSMYLSI